MVRESLRECEELVRTGRLQKAVEKLRALRLVSIPDADRLAVARLCRRIGLIGTGLRVLSPLIRDRVDHLTERERAKARAEYAVLLQRRSVTTEAARLLEKVDRKYAPEADLYVAFGLFQSWDYESAKPYLVRYIAAQDEPYQKLIGKVNLAAALVNTESDTKAEELTAEILEEALRTKAQRLAANALEMRAELLIRKDRDSEAMTCLKRAHAILGGTKLHDQLFIRQWQCFIEARKLRAVEPLVVFQKEALERQDWESVREADFLSLLVEASRPRLEQLYFGSPLRAYRERLCRRLGLAPLTESPIVGHGPLLDLEDGWWQNRRLSPKDLQFLKVFLQDFYRPVALGTIFSALYPGEIFDPLHSPGRVHQRIHRFRQRLGLLGLSHDLEVSKFGYRLRLHKGIALKRPHDIESVSVATHRLGELLRNWPNDRSFDRRDLEEHLGVGKSRALHMIQAALAEGLIQKNPGRGKAQRYLKLKGT